MPGLYRESYDLDGDGVVTNHDVSAIPQFFMTNGSTCACDFNGDGIVDACDQELVHEQAFGPATPPPTPPPPSPPPAAPPCSAQCGDLGTCGDIVSIARRSERFESE